MRTRAQVNACVLGCGACPATSPSLTAGGTPSDLDREMVVCVCARAGLTFIASVAKLCVCMCNICISRTELRRLTGMCYAGNPRQSRRTNAA